MTEVSRQEIMAAVDAGWQSAAKTHREATATRQNDERALLAARETFVVTRLFHHLDPARFSRSETPMDDARTDLIAEREAALRASRAAETAARIALDAFEKSRSSLTAELTAAEAAQITAAPATRPHNR